MTAILSWKNQSDRNDTTSGGSVYGTSAETQSGLPLLPWSCYASVIQCDIIQYLLFLFYYNTGIISFLAIYNDTILCTIFCDSERLYAKKHCF